MARKKQRQRFVREVKALLLSLGAVQSDDRFTLQTKAGKMTLYLDEHETFGLGSLYTRFDDPKAASEIVACNWFSGKWNHCFPDAWDVDTAIVDLKYWLRKVMK
jgi:hypothetical protein